MYEPSCCQPRADKYRAQIHQLDGITGNKQNKEELRLEFVTHFLEVPVYNCILQTQEPDDYFPKETDSLKNLLKSLCITCITFPLESSHFHNLDSLKIKFQYMRGEKQTETLATSLVINKLIEINNAFSQIIWLPLSILTSPFFTAVYSELFTCKYIKNT